MNLLQPPYASFRAISTQTGNNNVNMDPTMAYEAMPRATSSYVEMLKNKTRVYTLRTLRREGIGTTCVESLTKRLCSHPEKAFMESARSKVIRVVMTEKLGDAYRVYKRSKYESNKIWREAKKVIVGVLRDNFLVLWRPYVGRVTKKLQGDAEKKVDWLTSKWKRTETIPDIFEDVVIRTDDVPVYDNTPRLYGGVVVDDDEKEALLLPPKFAIFDTIDLTQWRIQIEESLNKLRWNRLLGDKKGKGRFSMRK